MARAWANLFWHFSVIPCSPKTTDFGCIAKVVGSGDPKNHSKGLGYVFKTYLGLFTLIKHEGFGY